MDGEYSIAKLSAEDQQRVQALERELGEQYGRPVVLIAYEKLGRSGSAGMEVGAFPSGADARGSTFGFSESHGDHAPTLGSLKYGRIAEGEDLRLSDAEPPSRESPPRSGKDAPRKRRR